MITIHRQDIKDRHARDESLLYAFRRVQAALGQSGEDLTLEWDCFAMLSALSHPGLGPYWGLLVHHGILEKLPLHQVDLSGLSLEGSFLERFDLRSVDLTNTDLGNSYLAGANLHEVHLRGTRFRGANLRKSNLINATFTEVDFREADLEESYTQGCTFTRCLLSGARL